MRISYWSSDVCSSGLAVRHRNQHVAHAIHLGIDARLLEGAQQTQASDLRHLEGRDLAALEPDRPAVDRVVADDGVEQRGLAGAVGADQPGDLARSEEHTSELQSLMRISYAVFCLKKKKKKHSTYVHHLTNPKTESNHK